MLEVRLEFTSSGPYRIQQRIQHWIAQHFDSISLANMVQRGNSTMLQFSSLAREWHQERPRPDHAHNAGLDLRDLNSVLSQQFASAWVESYDLQKDSLRDLLERLPLRALSNFGTAACKPRISRPRDKGPIDTFPLQRRT